jgi:glycosyltransferase involved in cell wall biosynthesis
MKKIIILSLYPQGLVPGPRFRYEQYLNFLKERFEVRLLSFFNKEDYKKIHSGAHSSILVMAVVKGYLWTIYHVLKCLNADFVFIYRDVTPFGFPLAEWIIAKVLRKKIIYDFDDAVWLTDLSPKERIKIWLRNPPKTDKIISWSHKISCGNSYLCHHAHRYNNNVVLNPTTIDTANLHNEVKDQYTSKVVIGWTGSHSTLKYLDPIVPVIAKLEKELEFDFVVICNKNPSYELHSFHFKPWNKKTEIEDLLTFNIGVMPLPDDEWSKGKCGFKALQYMALGMPALVSPVGVNADIVQNGINGFFCESFQDWEKNTRLLLSDAKLRATMGKQAIDTVEKHYSVLSNKDNFLSLFDE